MKQNKQQEYFFFGKPGHLRWRDVGYNFKSQNLGKRMNISCHYLTLSSDAKERKSVTNKRKRPNMAKDLSLAICP